MDTTRKIVYRRDGEASSGDAKLVLDMDASEGVEVFGEAKGRRGNRIAGFTDPEGREIRFPLRSNVYSPNGDVETATFTVSVETVARSTSPATSAPEGTADPLFDALLAKAQSGNAKAKEALVSHIATTRKGYGKVKAAELVDALV